MTFIIDKLIPSLRKLDYKVNTLSAQIRSWVFFNIKDGYTCSICGAKHLRFSYFEMESKTPRMIMSAYCNTGGNVCPDCVIGAISYVFAYKEVPRGKCDFSGEEGYVVRTIESSDNPDGICVRFGREYWNGFYASYSSLLKAVQECSMKSSVYNATTRKYSSSKTCSLPQTYAEFRKKNNRT